MDRALWISWYDLPDDTRDAYLRWAHGSYIPDLLKRPGFLWGAHYKTRTTPPGIKRPMEGGKRHSDDPTVPKGNRYILIFGADDPYVFANPTPSKLHASLPETSRNMLSTRVGERMNIMIDEARVSGPEVTKPERNMAFSPCIQLGSFNALREEEEDMLAWYARWRIPTIATLPGTIRTRKLVSILGWAKHAILTEWISIEARDKYFPTHEDGRPDMQAWTDKVTGRLIHAPGSSSVAERIWPAYSKR